MTAKILLDGWWWYGNRQNKAHKVFAEGYRPSWCPEGMTATVCWSTYRMLAAAPEDQPKCKLCLQRKGLYEKAQERP